MNQIFRTAARWLVLFCDPRKLLACVYLPRFVKHWRRYNVKGSGQLKFTDSYPCLTDWIASTPFDPHYFYQGAWLARRLVESKPKLHVDVGSSVLTIGVVSAQVPVVFVDYRPLTAKLSNLLNVGGSIVALPFATASINSLSCMHVLEHIGLGRYGDPIDPDGPRKALSELVRVLAPGGRLYLTTPVGRERVCFNAHRVFSPTCLPDLMPELSLNLFSWVDDTGQFNICGLPDDALANEYACGFYEFEKPYV